MARGNSGSSLPVLRGTMLAKKMLGIVVAFVNGGS